MYRAKNLVLGLNGLTVLCGLGLMAVGHLGGVVILTFLPAFNMVSQFRLDPPQYRLWLTLARRKAALAEDTPGVAVRRSLSDLSAALSASGDRAAIVAGRRLEASAHALLDAVAASPTLLSDARRPLLQWLPALVEPAREFSAQQRQSPRDARRDDMVTLLDHFSDRLDQIRSIAGRAQI